MKRRGKHGRGIGHGAIHGGQAVKELRVEKTRPGSATVKRRKCADGNEKLNGHHWSGVRRGFTQGCRRTLLKSGEIL